MLPSEPIHPLKDVWLRPRRVFRELSTRPVSIVDFLLAAVVGTGNFMALYRAQGAGAHGSVAGILGSAMAYGTVAGMTSLLFMGVIYARLSARFGGKATVAQVMHVLAYGSVPMAASVGVWVLAALLIGETAFVATPRAGLEGFPAILLNLQLAVYILLFVWSVVLQVMGLSEIQAFALRRAFGVWLLGQLVGLLASIFLAQLLEILFSSTLLHLIPNR